MQKIHENAVSPVIAIMLMLVVTVIIAAVVSGFAGGLVQSNNKAPQANIQGVFYVNGSSNLAVFTHMGGDALDTPNIQIAIRRSQDWGPYQANINGNPVISKTQIYNSAGLYWLNATSGSMDVLVWRPGETMYYLGSNTYTSSDVGKTLILEIDTTDGKLISKSNMMIVS
jgi:FlaG/FlaF family flagellin (archaellin)